MIEIVRTALWILAGYGGFGGVFAAIFHRYGLIRLDPGTRGAGFGFRCFITPGIIALWPVLARAWWREHQGQKPVSTIDAPAAPRRLRQAHALTWKALAVLMPVTVGWVLSHRPNSTLSVAHEKLWRASLSAPAVHSHP